MTRTIKFRGRDMNGHFVYGLLTKKKIRSSGEIRWAIATGNCSMAETVPVNEKSIAQLVGYEVYEGDILVDDEGNYHTARLESLTQNPDNAGYCFWSYPTKLKLKEITP